MKFMLGDGWHEEVTTLKDDELREDRFIKDGKRHTREEWLSLKDKPDGKTVLQELTHEFDHNYGTLNVMLQSLKNIRTELGIVSEDVVNTDNTDIASMGLSFRNIDHKIQLLADLMHYTVKELDKTLDETNEIKEQYFEEIIRKTVPADTETVNL